jgi:hypothetical protein
MPLPGGSGSQDLFDDFDAELAGGQHEERLKAEVIEIGSKSAAPAFLRPRAPLDVGHP